jgi:uncharacterized protein GlcG (DUF336 family)
MCFYRMGLRIRAGQFSGALTSSQGCHAGSKTMQLTLNEAKYIAGKAIEYALRHSALISICICDENGRFIALNRMDGAVATSNRQAIGKAIASASSGRASDHMPASDDIPQATATVTGEGMPLLHRRGGLPIYRNGVLIGSCGVGGSDSDAMDEACAAAGIREIDGLDTMHR